MDFKIEIAEMDTSKFRIFEGQEAYAVMDVIVEHLELRKFGDHFEPSMTHWNGHKLVFNPLFTIEKTDSSLDFKKFRTIFNAAAPRPRTQFQTDVLNGMYDNHPNFLEFKELAAIRSMNDNMLKEV